MKYSTPVSYRLFWVAILLVGTLLAGCGSGNHDTVMLHGQIDLPPGTDMPRHGAVRISLVQHDVDLDQPRRIVAERTLHGIKTVPAQFKLRVGRALLAPDGNYGVTADVLDANGIVQLSTPIPKRVDLSGDPGAISLDVKPSDGNGRLEFVKFRCGDGFMFAVDRDDSHAVLHLGTRQLTLDSGVTHPGSNTRYTDDHGNALRIGVHKASIAVDGTIHEGCDLLPADYESQRPRGTGGEGR